MNQSRARHRVILPTRLFHQLPFDPTSVLHIVGHTPAPNPSGDGANASPVLQVVGGSGGDGVFGGDGGGVVARAGNGGHGSVFGGSGGGVVVYRECQSAACGWGIIFCLSELGDVSTRGL